MDLYRIMCNICEAQKIQNQRGAHDFMAMTYVEAYPTQQ